MSSAAGASNINLYIFLSFFPTLFLFSINKAFKLACISLCSDYITSWIKTHILTTSLIQMISDATSTHIK